MKRNFLENSTRTTAGCLPVPLFNQKKRSRQPLTSNPLENEPSISNSDLCFQLEHLGKLTTEPGGHIFKACIVCLIIKFRKPFHRRLEESPCSANIWKSQGFLAVGNSTQHSSTPQVESSSECSVGSGSKHPKTSGQLKAPWGTKAGGAEQSYPTTAQKPLVLNAMPRGPALQGTLYAHKFRPFQQKANEKKVERTPDKGTVYQSQLKGKDNSLRILSVVIESMKHWSQYANKTPLLFEMLGVLDSAVTPGQYGAKTFLLRDGKENVPCVFYEIDRELPRLIRGRVHRCVGNYDLTRKVFKCVSVRPATAAEQQTFQEFVRISDLEMSKYMKTSHEV
uniref:Spermatosis associated 22 n=1 Tax=Salvator merianae TaxID=96440 RepID=A0A8D0BEA7_SALMN